MAILNGRLASGVRSRAPILGARIQRPGKSAIASTTLGTSKTPQAVLHPESSHETSWAVAVCVYSEELQRFVHIEQEGIAIPEHRVDEVETVAKKALAKLCSDGARKKALLTANEISFSSLDKEGTKEYWVDKTQWIVDNRPKQLKGFLNGISPYVGFLTGSSEPLFVEKDVTEAVATGLSARGAIAELDAIIESSPWIETTPSKKKGEETLKKAEKLRNELLSKEPLHIAVKEQALAEIARDSDVVLHPTVTVDGDTLSSKCRNIMSAGKPAFIPISVQLENNTKHAITLYAEPGYLGWTLHLYDPLGKKSSIDIEKHPGIQKVIAQVKGQFFGGSARVAVKVHQAENHQKPGTKDCARYQIMFLNHIVQGGSIESWINEDISETENRCKEVAEMVHNRMMAHITDEL